MKILMLSSTFPYPPSRSGTEVRTFNLLKYLQKNHEVTVVAQRSPDVSQEDIDKLQELVSDLRVFPIIADDGKGAIAKGRRLFSSLWEGKPQNVLHRYLGDIQSLVLEGVEQGKYDAITCEHSANAVYLQPQLRDRVRMVVNVHSSMYWGTRSAVETGASDNPWRDRFYLPILYRYENQYAQIADTLVVTTEDDRELLQAFTPAEKIAVIPNGVDLDLFPYRNSDPGGQTLAFVGSMDLTHNMDAALFFAKQVFPKLRDRYPEIKYRIIGNRPSPDIRALGNIPGVEVTGRVPSMVQALHETTVCVVSLQTGFGIKNKTLEAMAAGVPVVGSDRGLEGLDAEDVALRANTVEEYIEAISRLLENPELRQELSQNGRKLIEDRFTWEQMGKQYEAALQ
ncbi:glycosyltransferase family 4 protein [Roseofilum casamattae]|uniref:Glycosyltransferase family 4 protein n=1 Tax=Roseofilum casamattae BLCC-M143 TaxID=3022442 RepID=A0ABT7C4B5_9CYAN|nr:glycosyltransferase family 4 protein [Roseofilum casamattae BLCC-M143]